MYWPAPDAERCRATYDEFGNRCEDTHGHDDAHWFKTYVNWWGCWGCRADCLELHAPDCPAVLEAIEAWLLRAEAQGFEFVTWEVA